MRIVVAPDSFKGSIGAVELSMSIAKGILDIDPAAEIVELPLADGGEGTAETMVHASGGRLCSHRVSDPLGRLMSASYGVLGDGRTAVIETAQASGLTLLKEEERAPMLASSKGTGELLVHALDAGYRRFIVGLGGSATNDGGAGLLSALGARFLDHRGEELGPGGAALKDLASIDMTRLDNRLLESEFIMASDVRNPLCGPNGASRIFGPQKGASSEQIRILDDALRHYGDVMTRTLGMDVRTAEGSGAAGGIGFALLSVMGAKMRSGIEVIMEAIDFDKRIRGADLIVTGEGRLDRQTLSGKAIEGVCRKGRQHGIRVIALCGSTQLTEDEMDQLGLGAAFSIVPGPCSLEQAISNASEWVRRQTRQIMKLVLEAERRRR